MQENVRFYMSSEGSREWAKATPEAEMISSIACRKAAETADDEFLSPFPDIHATGKEPRIFAMGKEENALHLLFSVSRPARETMAKEAARRLIGDSFARGLICSDATIQKAMANPFQYDLDFMRTLSGGCNSTEHDMQKHLLDKGNSVVFLRLFQLLAPCSTRDMIGRHWANNSHYEGFSFTSESGEHQEWVSRRWLARNGQNFAAGDALMRFLAPRRMALPAPAPAMTAQGAAEG